MLWQKRHLKSLRHSRVDEFGEKIDKKAGQRKRKSKEGQSKSPFKGEKASLVW